MEGSEKMPKKIIPALCAALVLVTAAPAVAHDTSAHGNRQWQGSQWQGGQYHAHPKQQSHQKQRYKKHHRKEEHRRVHHRHVAPRVIWHSGHRWSPAAAHHHKPHHKSRHVIQRHRRDDNWALYAILALQLAEALNDSQRDNYAWAQQRAVAAPIGDTIRWQDGGASGSVIATREGSLSDGRYCREFQQQITVGNRSQSGYGIACRQPDGAWEIVS